MRSANYRRLGIGTLDQATSSLSNTVVIFAIARVADVQTFGRISLVLAALATALAATRGVLGTPITLLSHDRLRLNDEAGFALTSALVGGCLGAGALMAASAWSNVATEALVIAVSLPIVLAQDVARFHAISLGRPTHALASDGMWALGGIGLFGWTAIADVSPFQVLTGWLGLAVAALWLLLAKSGLRPKMTGITAWIRSSVGERLRYGGEAVIGTVAALLILVVATWALTSAATAALRGASSIMGPLSLLMSAITVSLVPELRRSQKGQVDAARAWVHLRKVSFLLSTIALSVGIVAWAAPDGLGTVLLGDSWEVARGIVPITAVEYAALAWLTGYTAGLRSQGRSNDLLSIRLVYTVMMLLLSLTGGLLAQSVWGFSVGLAVAAAIGAYLARRRLLNGSTDSE